MSFAAKADFNAPSDEPADWPSGIHDYLGNKGRSKKTQKHRLGNQQQALAAQSGESSLHLPQSSLQILPEIRPFDS